MSLFFSAISAVSAVRLHSACFARRGTMPEREKLVEMLRLMYRIRSFEEKVRTLYDYYSFQKKGDMAADEYDIRTSGVIAGAAHLAIGQEAAKVGTCAALDEDDFVASTHRGHGHAIAKGADLKRMMAELMGRKTWYSKGCGGSMHIFSSELGLLGGNGIPEELEVWKQRDPITLFEKRLIEDGHMTSDEQDAMKKEVIAQVEKAEAFGKESPFPECADLPVPPGVEVY